MGAADRGLAKWGIASSSTASPTALLHHFLFLVPLIPGIFLVEKRQEKILLFISNFSSPCQLLLSFPCRGLNSMKRFPFSLLSPIKFPPWGNGYRMTSLIEGAKGQRKYSGGQNLLTFLKLLIPSHKYISMHNLTTQWHLYWAYPIGWVQPWLTNPCIVFINLRTSSGIFIEWVGCRGDTWLL